MTKDPRHGIQWQGIQPFVWAWFWDTKCNKCDKCTILAFTKMFSPISTLLDFSICWDVSSYTTSYHVDLVQTGLFRLEMTLCFWRDAKIQELTN